MHKKPNRTQIPFEGSSGRTPTGAMQFANDWPGLFIRGDNTGPIHCAIRRLQQHCGNIQHWEVQMSLQVLDEIATIIENDVTVRKEELES
jgi:hypothetical protein